MVNSSQDQEPRHIRSLRSREIAITLAQVPRVQHHHAASAASQGSRSKASSGGSAHSGGVAHFRGGGSLRSEAGRSHRRHQLQVELEKLEANQNYEQLLHDLQRKEEELKRQQAAEELQRQQAELKRQQAELQRQRGIEDARQRLSRAEYQSASGSQSTAVLLIAITWILEGAGGLPCSFNTMCSCKTSSNYSQDSVSCVAVPLSRLPDLPAWSQSVDVLESGLEVVDQDSLVLPLLVTLRLSSNRIYLLHEKSLMTSKSLRSLDLSYNKLQDVPLEVLRHSKGLEWLNLHGNDICCLNKSWKSTGHSLTHLFLGENDLLEAELFGFHRLISVSFDGNRLQHVQSLPSSLRTLTLSHNLFQEFPSLQGLTYLSWLYLRDNFIHNLDGYLLPKRVIDKLDLGENFLSKFNLESHNTTVIRDLNLDLNNFKTLPELAFKGFEIGRISISNNRLETVHDKALDNLKHVLEYLDLGGNRLDKIPRALGSLKMLKYLYVPSNNISEIQSDAMSSFSENLGALSLLGNKLTSIPKPALKKCQHLAHLNLGYNIIKDVKEDDFLDWGTRLDTLLLMNNRIIELPEHTFKHTPRLRELSLSFNKIINVHPLSFSDVRLESLEISFGMYQEDFPEDLLKPLTSLMWLSLDNNDFHNITENALLNLGSLRYLNLDGNKLYRLPNNLFRAGVHRHLRDVRISDNLLEYVESNTFLGLEEMQFIVLERNQIRHIQVRAFCDLKNKVNIYLGNNRISSIQSAAFDNIPYLSKLDIHNNYLSDLKLDVFNNCTSEEFPMVLNISRNQLNILGSSEDWSPVYVGNLDASHNLLPDVPRSFVEAMKSSLRKINFGYNHINKLDEEAFGPLINLEALVLEHNEITKLRKRAFAGLQRLQILDVSHNHIDKLHMEQFKHLSNLRIIDLSFNHLRSIPRDAFQNTKLERIDLSHNEFLVMPSGPLGEVGYTLRILDMSNNNIEHLDSTIFPETPHLTGLNLANNRITLIPDNVFTSLGGLLSLDMSGNRLRANFKELFHYLQSLRVLNLAETGLSKTPVLPLPNLVTLNLSMNAISDFPVDTAVALPSLRSLLISNCNFLTLPSSSWPKMPLLKNLDVSFNPIKELTKDSFVGLRRLDSLDISGLDSLERLDGPRGCSALRSLAVDSGPALGTVLGPLTSLSSLSLRVREPKLKHLASLPPKIRHLHITGAALREVEPGALRNLRGEAVVSIRDTQIEELPLGLLSGMESVSHLTLDLRGNRITSLSPDTFYFNLTPWQHVGTKLISGGLLLKDNPLSCDCSLVWLGHWLRRWLRESLLTHTADPETGSRLVGAAREATCRERGGRRVSLYDLHPELMSCHASALSPASRTVPTLAHLLVAFLVLR